MATFAVWSLDVWGHGPEEHVDYGCNGTCAGYQVNDRAKAGEVGLSEEPTGQEVLAALQNLGFLNDSLPESYFTVESTDGDFWEVNRASDGRYLSQLERVR